MITHVQRLDRGTGEPDGQPMTIADAVDRIAQVEEGENIKDLILLALQDGQDVRTGGFVYRPIV